MATPTPEQIRSKLQAVAAKGGDAGKQAQRLLEQLDQSPETFNDPNWRNQVDQSLLYASGQLRKFGAAGDVQGGLGNQIELNNRTAAEKVRQAEARAIDQEMLDLTRAEREENRRFVDENLTPRIAGLDNEAGVADFTDGLALQNQERARQEGRAALGQLTREATDSANRFNEFSGDAWGRFADENRALNAQDQGAVDRYMSETDPLMQQLAARGYGENVVADPEGLARQREAIGLARGAAEGGLDYQSLGARAFADQGDVAAQRGALQMLLDEARGGGTDQRDVMNRYKELTSPEVTAQERYLAEIARRQFEAGDRSNREAVRRDHTMRGLNSGTLEIADSLAGLERLSNDRMMAELGLQAGAVDRSMQALSGYGTAANSLRAGNQAAQGAYGDLATSIRDASFEEAYKRGQAADAASANNQTTRMSGITQTGAMAGQIRDANDAINTFNKEQSQITQRFQDSFAQDEADRVGKLAGERSGETRSTTKQVGDRNQVTYDSEQNMLDTNYGREKDARDLRFDVQTGPNGIYDMDSDVNDMTWDLGERRLDRRRNVTDTVGNIAGTRAGGGADLDRLLATLAGKKLTTVTEDEDF